MAPQNYFNNSKVSKQEVPVVQDEFSPSQLLAVRNSLEKDGFPFKDPSKTRLAVLNSVLLNKKELKNLVSVEETKKSKNIISHNSQDIVSMIQKSLTYPEDDLNNNFPTLAEFLEKHKDMIGVLVRKSTFEKLPVLVRDFIIQQEKSSLQYYYHIYAEEESIAPTVPSRGLAQQDEPMSTDIVYGYLTRYGRTIQLDHTTFDEPNGAVRAVAKLRQIVHGQNKTFTYLAYKTVGTCVSALYDVYRSQKITREMEKNLLKQYLNHCGFFNKEYNAWNRLQSKLNGEQNRVNGSCDTTVITREIAVFLTKTDIANTTYYLNGTHGTNILQAVVEEGVSKDKNLHTGNYIVSIDDIVESQVIIQPLNNRLVIGEVYESNNDVSVNTIGDDVDPLVGSIEIIGKDGEVLRRTAMDQIEHSLRFDDDGSLKDFNNVPDLDYDGRPIKDCFYYSNQYSNGSIMLPIPCMGCMEEKAMTHEQIVNFVNVGKILHEKSGVLPPREKLLEILKELNSIIFKMEMKSSNSDLFESFVRNMTIAGDYDDLINTLLRWGLENIKNITKDESNYFPEKDEIKVIASNKDVLANCRTYLTGRSYSIQLPSGCYSYVVLKSLAVASQRSEEGRFLKHLFGNLTDFAYQFCTFWEDFVSSLNDTFIGSYALPQKDLNHLLLNGRFFNDENEYLSAVLYHSVITPNRTFYEHYSFNEKKGGDVLAISPVLYTKNNPLFEIELDKVFTEHINSYSRVTLDILPFFDENRIRPFESIHTGVLFKRVKTMFEDSRLDCIKRAIYLVFLLCPAHKKPIMNWVQRGYPKLFITAACQARVSMDTTDVSRMKKKDSIAIFYRPMKVGSTRNEFDESITLTFNWHATSDVLDNTKVNRSPHALIRRVTGGLGNVPITSDKYFLEHDEEDQNDPDAEARSIHPENKEGDWFSFLLAPNTKILNSPHFILSGQCLDENEEYGISYYSALFNRQPVDVLSLVFDVNKNKPVNGVMVKGPCRVYDALKKDWVVSEGNSPRGVVVTERQARIISSGGALHGSGIGSDFYQQQK